MRDMLQRCTCILVKYENKLDLYIVGGCFMDCRHVMHYVSRIIVHTFLSSPCAENLSSSISLLADTSSAVI